MNSKQAPLKLSGKDQGGPLYLQIASLMRQRIQTGHWKPGEQLPTLGTLAEQFSVALVTVRQAVGMLEKEGLIWRKQGKGTFVSENAQAGRWIHLKSDWNSLLQHLVDKEPHLLNMEGTFGNPELSPDDGLPTTSYRNMRRVHSYEGIPYALADIYLDKQVYDLAPDEFDKKMVIPLIESLSEVEIQSVRQTFSFSIADVEVAALLDIPPNSPIGEVRRVILDKQGYAIYISDTKYRGDFVKLDVNFER